ncbi:MAG: fumarylacetoacetate hydrolase family protein [Micropepsaceae bacterium]
MKLATLRDGTRDGRLAVVSRDLTRAAYADGIAKTLQAALDDWDDLAPRLAALNGAVNGGSIQTFPFDQANALAPLPRAYQWADGSAYVNHVALVRKARNAEMPDSFWTDPLMYQGGSDIMLAPNENIPLADPAHGLDCEAEVAVITGDVPLGASEAEAEAAIKLVVILNDVSLRNLIPNELAKGFGFFQSKPSTAFAPIAVTPRDLGDAWREGRLHGALSVALNDVPFGKADAGVDMTFNFPRLIAHAARTRALGAGAIIGSGTVSNRGANGDEGKPIADGGVGYSCIAELRAVETIRQGKPQTPFMKPGDRVRIEMHDETGHSIFGAIDQQVVAV